MEGINLAKDMEVEIFYDDNPDTVSEQITGWLKKNPGVEIKHIEQSTMPPDRFDPKQWPDPHAYLIISVWYNTSNR